jgi:general secretion pathway protein K
MNRGRQRGVALIIALILVALATILASKLTFDGFLERRRAIGVLAAEQAVEFGYGAESLAADVLIKDAQNGGNSQTTLAGAWAQPTQPLPITPQDNPEGEPIGTLQGEIEDMQGRFNLNNLAHLVAAGAPGANGAPAANGVQGALGAQGAQRAQPMIQDPKPYEQFKRLLISVNLEPRWADIARDWIDEDDTPGPEGAEDQVYTSQTPPYRTGNWPMMSPTELMNMPGFGADRYRKIAPYVAALPTATAQINICTAPALVLESLSPKLSGEFSRSPEVMASARKIGCFPDKSSFAATLVGSADVPPFGTTSSYFRLTTRVTLGTTEFTLYSLLYRGGSGGSGGGSGNGKVSPLLRSFGTP